MTEKSPKSRRKSARKLTALSNYNRYRVHQSLKMDVPDGRTTQAIEEGDVTTIPHVGGLHHTYERRAAKCLQTRADQFLGWTVPKTDRPRYSGLL